MCKHIKHDETQAVRDSMYNQKLIICNSNKQDLLLFTLRSIISFLKVRYFVNTSVLFFRLTIFKNRSIILTQLGNVRI